MKKFLGIAFGIPLLLTLVHAEMKCAPGKCGGGKCGGNQEMTQPKKMMMPFQSVTSSEATLLQQGDAKAFCPNCGMTLPMYYKTNHAATVDGKVKQYCSIHCLAEDIEKGLKLSDIKAVDMTSLKFVEASKAYYVVGSSKPGTMSMTSKYAFANEADAKAFAQANGGEVTGFEAALKAAKEDFAKDSAMVAKKQAMMVHKGEELYTRQCTMTDKKFGTTAEAKAFIVAENLCGDLDQKQLQAVGLYLKNR